MPDIRVLWTAAQMMCKSSGTTPSAWALWRYAQLALSEKPEPETTAAA